MGALSKPALRGPVRLNVPQNNPQNNPQSTPPQSNPQSGPQNELRSPQSQSEANPVQQDAAIQNEPRNRPQEPTRRENRASSEAGATAKRGRKPGRPSRATVISVVKDIADAADPRPSRAVPTAKDWEPHIERGLVYLSVGYVWWLTTDDEGNELGDTSKYELDDERAGLIASPLARLWARTPLNRRYGRDLIENMDSLVAVVALVTYVMDTRPLWRARKQRMERRANVGNNVIRMHRAQTNNAPTPQRPEPQPLEQSAPTQSQPTNGGSESNEPERPPEGPYKHPLPFTPGEQHRAD